MKPSIDIYYCIGASFMPSWMSRNIEAMMHTISLVLCDESVSGFSRFSLTAKDAIQIVKGIRPMPNNRSAAVRMT